MGIEAKRTLASEPPANASARTRRCRPWLISPEGFRELRHSCLLSNRKAAAAYLGVCERTIRHWDSGRCRVPWSVVRLLRLRRMGDLGALEPTWSGWSLNRHGLMAPNGHQFAPFELERFWMQFEQARFWREDYQRRTTGGVGAKAPALTLQPEVREAGSAPAAAPFVPIGAIVPVTALAGRRGRRGAPSSAGMAVTDQGREIWACDAAAGRSHAGLVSSSKQVERQRIESRWRRRLQGVVRAG